MDRVDADWFRYAYSVQQNRDIHLARFAKEDREREALRDLLNRRYLLEQRQFELLTALGADRDLVERVAAAAGRGGQAEPIPALGLRGVGFFEESGGEAPILGRLRARVLAERGSDYLIRRTADLRAALRSLPLAVVTASALEAGRDRDVPDVVPLSERFTDLALQRAALATLRRAATLRPDRLRTLDGNEGRLTEQERRGLQSFANRLEARLVQLPESQRPDWGYPMLLGMARLAAIDLSLAHNRLVVLDGYPHDARTLPGSTGGDRRAFLAELEEGAARQVAAARQALSATPELGERGYNALEDAANRLLEVRGSRAEAHPLRVSGDRLVPEGWTRVAELPLPRARGADLGTLWREARDAEQHYARALRELHEYHVVRHNCATELLRTLEAGAERGDPPGTLHFIPALAFRGAKRRDPNVAEAWIPSYRTTRLAEMKQHENRLAVSLRESNTLTSSIYRRSPHDSWFLFFTDDRIWPRPFLGAFNVATGIAETTWGLLALPVAGTERLRSGASGLIFSLPELAFLNFRKGTLEYGRGEAPLTRPQPVRGPQGGLRRHGRAPEESS